MKDNAKKQALSTRTEQDGTGQHPPNNRSEGWTEGDSRSIGDLSSGSNREIGAWSITGGILAQLIKKTESQLENDEACIKWYEAEREKHRKELDELLALRELEARQRDE